MTPEEIAEKLKKQNDEAILLLYAGNYEKAYAAFALYLRDLVTLKLWKHAARARVNMANTLYLMGEYEKALSCLEMSLKFFQEEKDVVSLNENRVVEGNIYLKQGDCEKLCALSDLMYSSTQSDKIKAIANIFKTYAMRKLGNEKLDVVNKAVLFAERSKDNAVLKHSLLLRADYYERNNKQLYAVMDRNRVALL